MNEKNKKEKKYSIDWRVVFGVCLTATWIAAGFVYLLVVVGWVNFVTLPTGEIGNFLEGAFAPLAFLWLVIGHFMQQTEISANTKAATSQEQSARRQEVHSHRNSYFKLLSLVQQQLGSNAGFHFISVCGPSGTGEVSSEEYASMRTESANGDSELFVRKMLTLAVAHNQDKEELNQIFFGTDIRRRHSTNFVKTFGKLLKHAEAVDDDDMVLNALLYGSPSGILFRIIRYLQGEEQSNPITAYADGNMGQEFEGIPEEQHNPVESC